MRGFITRVLITALGLWIATNIVSGIAVAGWKTLLFAAVVLGVVNAIVRPVLFFLTLPLTLLTLGLFIFVLNAICFELTAWLVPGFSIDGFRWALGGALVVSIVS